MYFHDTFLFILSASLLCSLPLFFWLRLAGSLPCWEKGSDRALQVMFLEKKEKFVMYLLSHYENTCNIQIFSVAKFENFMGISLIV